MTRQARHETVVPIRMGQIVYVWIFPKDRFVEWGPEDESCCRLAGYGHEESRRVRGGKVAQLTLVER